jgi:toxin-antitoxin system PIN domain toxin
MTPDLNILVAAFRTDHPHHETARAWLVQARHDCALGSASLTLLPMIAAGFLRLVTNPRVFSEPDPMEDAVAFIDVLLDSPGVEMHDCGKEWPLLRDKLLTLGLHGNLVTDAWIASAVQTIGEHLVSFDDDFKRLLPTRDLTLLDPAG